MIDLKTVKVLDSIEVKDYKCPNCGTNNSDNEYEVDGVEYPQYFNVREGSTMDGNYHDLDELHKCEECGTEYWFENGAY